MTRFYKSSQTVTGLLIALATALVLAGCSRSGIQVIDSGEPDAISHSSSPTRTIEHAFGRSAVPLQPQRVVLLNPVVDLDNLLALGIVPVGIAGFTADRGYSVPPYLSEQVAESQLAGNLVQPDLEQIVRLNPDLIVATDAHSELYPQLSQIAPTVALPTRRSDNLRSRLLALADIVNRRERASEAIAAYEANLTSFRDTVGDRLDDIEVSFIRVRSDGIFLYIKSSITGAIFEEAGVRRPPSQDVSRLLPRIPISLETLERADGDIIFMWGDFASDAAARDRLQANPLWQQLNAVRNQQTHVVSEVYWFFPGIQGASLLLEDLQEYLVRVPSQPSLDTKLRHSQPVRNHL
ncbi:ABC transporter substrate-binding protein [Synechococcus sp. PCC 7336]|uniref:ABC transporter substrate-binding protein n=1 Tax=Synechococcus sp. PCC 7336 TaxID=195250 RepID=UPI00034C8B87|nr:ABC transporter substrate-binding protein [Synechococcus sp. PCC 7336]